MGTTRKTITITDQQDEWIKAQIEGGDFTNDNEYIRDLIVSGLLLINVNENHLHKRAMK